ncbi:molybdate transport repressor [Campylobacter sp. RM16192]|uniref:molybdate transport repressor n=1 Tax=Campylobacter sp. RM16192 TaxID=1660080 RepID=UPI001452020E|nr:molybdate transport repressor [Campylobacter sp. RM16192]QCD51863.1 putative membrane protein [Campylobacter sp. RM16192]
MQIKENKKGAIGSLVMSILLFLAGLVGYLYYELSGSGIFTMVISFICAVFCVKKIVQESFIEIFDDGFGVKKGSKQHKFYFKDIDEISTRVIDKKRDIQVLNVKFKRGKLDRDAADGLIQPIGENDAIILDKYEKSKYEIFNLLREKLQKLNTNK